jgi:hypothetical protein
MWPVVRALILTLIVCICVPFLAVRAIYQTFREG